MLSKIISDSEIAAISYANFGGKWADPQGAVLRVVGATMRNAGAEMTTSYSSRWRGKLSAIAKGKISSDSGELFVSARVVELREQNGSISFLTIGGSLFQADRLREDLELSTQVMK